MKRSFVANLALLLFLNLLIKPLYAFGIDVGVQNAVGAGSYGSYFILLNFTIIFQIILDLGLENFTRREIAQNNHLLSQYFSVVFPLKLMLGLVYTLVCSLIGKMIGWGINEFRLLLVLMFNQFLSGFILYFRANMGGLHMFRSDSLISVIDRFVVIIICGTLLVNAHTRAHFRVEWLVYAQTAGYLISASLAFSLVLSKAGRFAFRFDPKQSIRILRHCLPYALLILLMATYLRIDSVLLGKLLVNGSEEAGIYAQSFRIIEIFSNYGYLFTILLLPIFSRMIRFKEPVDQLTRLSFTLLFIPALILTFGCVAYRQEVIGALYREHVEKSSMIFGLLIFSFLGICTTYIFGTLLTANGSLRQLNIMALFAVGLNLLLNYLLIRKYGVLGAAIANVVTQLFTSIYQIVLARKTFGFRIDRLFLLRLAVFGLVTGSSAFLFKSFSLPWYYSMGLYFLFAFALSLAIGLIRLRPLFGLLRTVNEN